MIIKEIMDIVKAATNLIDYQGVGAKEAWCEWEKYFEELEMTIAVYRGTQNEIIEEQKE